MLPMLGWEVVERQQRIVVLDQATGCLVVFDLVSFDEGFEWCAGFLAACSGCSRSCAPSSVARGLSATPRRAPSRTRAHRRRPQSPAALSDRDAADRAADRATIARFRACRRADDFLLAFRCRANDDQDALRLILESSLQINAVGPAIDIALG